ncbi:MAG: hypothetical protein ACRERE_25005 [Candidatus Entotheonellia bacterium]
MKGVTVKTDLRMGLVLSVVAIVSVMMMFGQASAQTIKQQALSGGTYQVIDAATAPCSGQCAVANWQTDDCSCAPNYVPVQTARILISVGEGQNVAMCGSLLVSCVPPPPQ